ncbi:hypothetical protein ENUP19_0275G0008 [Entamoeba nuttalli]|uniref:5-nitroimidazole antibiotic resistance protein, putative n=2 Tax=Entamoeba nuttalli TaxID=412467 RepID=K2GUR1_ENTNP|nr:5-nitroimidazole antibiotic resistance protein, putative [Entamoeba nuttalli P19]EKE38848.1 5-nitroimidazole antibiotic resistance protein, putative [Entamoeba nuttalli P19]|eukprot:XP_008858820.1 5-nitroimidazole antibiotic resistance protein, putative [Entamoeba nuttalli P19]
MNYITSCITRKNSGIEETRAIEIIKNGEYGFMAMVDEENNSGYGVPINYAFDGVQNLYFHGGNGKKMNILKKNPKVSFTIVGKTLVVPEQFTDHYESVMCFGTICFDLSKEEKIKGMELIIDKYSSEYKAKGMKMVASAIEKMSVYKLVINSFSGKVNK